MSNSVYPVLPGLTFGVVRAPMWATITKSSASGREYRATTFQTPRYRYTLIYEFLRSAAAYAELQTLVSFFNALSGAWDTFLFQDPDDYQVTSQAFGTGDGVTTAFQLVRAFGSYVEPVYSPQATPTIFVAGTPTTPASINYNTGIVTFTTPPGAGAALTWTGQFYWRCRFEADQLDFSKFMAMLWELKKVSLITVKP